MDQAQVGVYRKFNVSRIDGRDQPGGDRAGAEYFVLDLTYDDIAPIALNAYALSCARQYPLLSLDIVRRYGLDDTTPVPASGAEEGFTALRAANIARQVEWDTGSEKVSLSYRGNELAGEVGELCNVLKKLERERIGIRGSRSTPEQAAQEIADVIICADLIAAELGIDLFQAVRDKFNATSERYGFTVFLKGGIQTQQKPREWAHIGEACDHCKHQAGDLENRWCTNPSAEPFSNRFGSGAKTCTHPIYPMFEQREKGGPA